MKTHAISVEANASATMAKMACFHMLLNVINATLNERITFSLICAAHTTLMMFLSCHAEYNYNDDLCAFTHSVVL